MNYKQLITDVENGNENPLRAYVHIQALIKELEQAKDYIQDYAILEASKHEKGSVIDGYEITYCKGRKNWNFKNIHEWQTKKEALTDLEEALKKAWEAKNSGFEQIDIATGEIKELPTVTYSNDYLTLKKIK